MGCAEKSWAAQGRGEPGENRWTGVRNIVIRRAGQRGRVRKDGDTVKDRSRMSSGSVLYIYIYIYIYVKRSDDSERLAFC